MSNTAKSNVSPSPYPKPNPPRRQPVHVLGVLHAGGAVEIFGERHVQVHLAIMPYMASAEGQIAAQEYVELNLPKPFRDLYWPVNLRKADMVRRVTPADIARVKANVELVEVLKRIGEECRGDEGKGVGETWIS